MDTKHLQEVEHAISFSLSESEGPVNQDTITLAVKEFLACDAGDFRVAKDDRHDRRVVRWIHALSHVIDSLWELRQYEHLQVLYKEAATRSGYTGDYGCMERLLMDFMRYARWFDNPRDYGFEESIPDYELLYARREQDEHGLKRVAERGIKHVYEQELIKIRLRGFTSNQEMSDWKRLQQVGWKKREN